MSLLNQSAFLKALGWSLMDSLWQMGLLWLLYVVLTANGKRFLAKQRHTLALFSIAGGFGWFLINLIVRFYEAANPGIILVESIQHLQGAFITSLSDRFDNIVPFISTGYLLIISFLFIRLATQYRLTKKLTTSGLTKAAPQLRLFVQDIVERMRIKKNVQIWLSDLVDTPVTIGFWKPFILLPVAAVNQLSIAQAEAIILHELNHIRRNDYLINLIISCSDIILFFNPFARALTDIIKKERENSCDDMVMQFQYKPSSYANALLLLEQNRVNSSSIAIAATGKNKNYLLNRVKRILTDKPVTTPVSHKLFGYLLSFSLFGIIGFYNPAEVIVRQIEPEQVKAVPVSSNETNVVFATEIVDEENEEHETSEVINSAVAEHEQAMKNDAIQMIVDELVLKVEKQQAALLEEQLEQEALIRFVSAAPEVREFSIAANKIVLDIPENPAAIYPYVPSASFSFHITEDTARPKKYIPTYSERQAKESLEKALKALKEIDWLKLEKQLALSEKNLDIVKLQKELKQAMEDVNWEKVNEEVESSLLMAQTELLQQQEQLREQLHQFQKQRLIQKEQHKKIKEQILEDRLCDPQPETPKPAPVIEMRKRKKTVEI